MTRSRRHLIVGALLFAILGGSTGILFAEEEASPARPDFAVDLAFVNKYVWRGMLLTDGPVFQPGATLGYKGASVSVWGNLDLDNVNDLSGEFNEIDLVLDYTHSIKEFSLSGGLIYYTFPNTDFRSTVELYVAAGADILLQPCLTIYFDVDQAEGFYGTLGFSHSFGLLDSDSVDIGLDLSTTVGLGSSQYNEYYFGVRDTAFTDFNATGSLPITIIDQLTVSPYVGVTVVLDTDLRAQMDESDNFLVGAVLSWSI